MEVKSLKAKVQSLKFKVFILCSCFFVLTSVLLPLSGCKVKYGLKGQTIPPEAKTISVATFKIGSESAGIMPPTETQLLSQRLRDAVSSQTNLALIKQNGDLRFEECKVMAYVNGPQSIGSGDVNRLNRLSVTISVDYVNSFDASKSFIGKTFTRYFDYDGSKTLSQVESEALDQINRQLIEDM
ncbi:MAG TPA: LPS assembly lipoprotein LptE, partial [Bacteroidia bacterium]|nr:LPS assembly lipoprotein LptE [Bacteroidia bacterium]